MTDLQKIVSDLNDALHENCPQQDGLDVAAICVSEEAGELIGAYRRWSGRARRKGTFEEVEKEVADLLITTLLFAIRAGIDIDKAIKSKLDNIYSRGWNE